MPVSRIWTGNERAKSGRNWRYGSLLIEGELNVPFTGFCVISQFAENSLVTVRIAGYGGAEEGYDGQVPP